MNKDLETKIQLKIAEMTVEQKLGHLVVCRAYPKTIDDEYDYIMDKLKRGCVGAIQGPCYEGYENFVFEAKEAAPNPILVCADMESGFPGAKRRLPTALAVSAACGDNTELAYQFGRITAIEAKKAGFNMVWGPIVDVKKYNSMLGTQRVFGSDPHKVAKLAKAVAKGYADEGMFFTAKHFPADPENIVDGHLYSRSKEKGVTAEVMNNTVMIPYLEFMKEFEFFGIMTTHGLHPDFDAEYPCTLSEKLVSFIRNAGFDGLLTTDSLGMVGIIDEFGEEGTIGLSIKAGHDMIIPNYRITYQQTMEYLENAYNKGVFTEERLNDAVRRVLIAQEIATKPASQPVLTEKELSYLDRLNSDSVYAITDEGVSPAIDKDKSHLFVILSENIYLDPNGKTVEIEPVDSWFPGELKEQLESDFPGSRAEIICEWPSKMHIHDISYYATHYDDVVFVTFCKAVAYGVHDELTKRVIRLMEALHDRISAVVHIGNPYAMEDIPHVPRIIGGFSGGECEKYALEVLAGKRVAVGTVPVNVKYK